MPIDLLLVENLNDLEITDFDLQLTQNNLEYVSQKLRIKLSLVKGEWYLNTEEGIPYYQDEETGEGILRKVPNLDNAEAIYKEAILELEEIKELNTFELSLLVNRQLDISFTATLTTNEILEFSEVI